MNDITTNTIMDPGRELFRDSPTAHWACLGCWGEGLILDKPSSSTLSLVGQHIKEHPPRRIRNMFSETMILKHSVNVEGFNPDESVLISENSALLMEEIQALINYFDMALSDLMDGFASISRTFLLTAQNSLKPFKLFFGFNQKAGIRYCFPATQCGEILNANIDADFPVWMRMPPFNRFKFAREDDKPLPGPISFDRHRLDLPPRNPMQDKGYVAYLGDMKSFIRQNLKPELGIGEGINPPLKTRKPHLNLPTLLPLLNSAEEVLIGFRQTIRTVLKGLRENSIKLRVGILNFLDDLTQLSFAVKRNTLIAIFSLASLKKQIIHFTTQIKLKKQPPNLFPGRIQPILIVPQLHDTYLDPTHINRCDHLPPNL